MLSSLIDPVVRRAQRFSFSSATTGRPGSESGLSHANVAHAHAHGSCPRAPVPTASPAPPPVETADGRPTDYNALNGRFRSPESLHSDPIGILPMSASPDHDVLENNVRLLQLDHTPANAAATATPPSRSRASSSVSGQPTTAVMTELLPADDGMRTLRARIHEIRDLTIPDDDKARMMHILMSQRYNTLRPPSPASFVSNDRPFTPTSGQSVFSDAHISSPMSMASEVDPENPFNLLPGDTDPTYRMYAPQHNAENGAEDDDFDTAEDGSSLGCQHYKRNVKVQCHACRRWHTCRHCHDAVEDHNLNRRKTQNMLCMVCQTPQSAAGSCTHCGTQAAWYYCDICKLWDDNSSKRIYHCMDCGICRKGEGLGKDYIHCKRCNVCISISHSESHKCLERATECDCPICGEYLFSSSSAVVSMPCGHYLHKGCYKQYMERAYKCPLCKKSAVNMALQWQKLTHAIEGQPMPEQFENTRAVIQCNDCSAKSSTKFHWLGNQCGTCDSYNTNELRIISGPESEEVANAIISAEAESRTRPASPSSPLRSPRYYFEPDQPEETWLPGQLPSFPFQMPQMPQLPQLPQMPQMPDASELMERVSRSFSPFRNYLNSTGEIADENVPIIDLGDEPPECQATDGSTVQQPSLPQYVLERFSRSFGPIRNYLNPSIDNIPRLDLSDGRDSASSQSWGEWRMDRFLSRGEEQNEDDDEDSSSDESADEDEEDEDGDADEDDKEFELPGHR